MFNGKIYVVCFLLVIVTVVVIIGCSKAAKNEVKSVVPKGEFVYFHLNTTQGGFLGNSHAEIKVNGEAIAFMGGEMTAKIAPFSGSKSTIINTRMLKGENEISISIIKKDDVDVPKKDDPLDFRVIIERAFSDETVSTSGGEKLLFELNKTIKPGELTNPLIYEGTFNY